MKIKYLLLSILFLFTNLYSQTFSIKGQAADSVSNEPLFKANVLLFHLPDSTRKGMMTPENGKFSFDNLKPGRYLINISFLGYQTFIKYVELSKKSVDLQKLLLKPGNVTTSEVNIFGKIAPLVQKVDTMEYNADAFKVNKDATAEDLVSKMPGLTSSDGKYQAHGEDVKRVLVDGRPFFGDDPSAVLRNVPAEIVDRIQVFDQQSEQARFTGFDDGNTSKTLNIVTRMRVRQGNFGRLSAGYGNSYKYRASGNINFFNNERRISVVTQLNNLNEQNFSIEDLSGVMQGSGRGGGMMGGMRGGGGQGGGDRGGRNTGGGGFQGGGDRGGFNPSDFFVNSKNGLTNTKALALNYSDKWSSSLELTGSYFINKTNNDAQNQLERQYFTTPGFDQNYNENSSSLSNNINHKFNLKLDYQIDSSNSLTFRPNLSAQLNDGSGNTQGNTFSSSQMLNSINNLFNSNITALNSNAELTLRHKFATTGRTISVEINTSYKKNKGTNNLFSENLYFDNVLSSDTLNQNSELMKDGYSGSANIVYTEPVSKTGILQFNTRLSYSDDKNDQKTFAKDYNNSPSSYLDSTLSNVYRKIYRTQSFGTGYRYQQSGLSLMVGVNFNLSQLGNNQNFPYSAKMEKQFTSILPSVMLRYGASRDQSLQFWYRTNNNSPSVDQLQNVLNNSNPVQLSTGNPQLKQDYSHSLMLRYNHIDFENMNSYLIMLGGSYTNDYIGNNTFIATSDTLLPEGVLLQRGSQLSKPVNLDGYYNFRSFFFYSLPVDLLKSNLNFPLNLSYSHYPSVINGITSFTNSLNYGIGFSINSNIGEDLDFSVSTNSSFSNSTNSSRLSSNNSTYNQNSRVRFYWLFWKGFLLQTDMNHQYDKGLGSDYNRNSLIWNLHLGKKLFSNDQGEIRLSALDILNQNTNVQRNVTDYYLENSKSNVLGSYFLLTFSYRISAF